MGKGTQAVDSPYTLAVNRIITLSFLVILTTACANQPTSGVSERPSATTSAPTSSTQPLLPEELPRATLHISSDDAVIARFQVSVAETPAARAKGLMGVERMSDEMGMVFLFDSPTRGSFYMKNTLIPLDIAFWESGGRIVDILQMQPCREDPCPLYEPSVDYVGAVEVNLGALDKKGVKAGHIIQITR